MATIETLNNGESGSVIRGKINTNFTNLNNDKVEKVTGKGLSQEDYTTTEKNKLAGIGANAKVVSVTGGDNCTVNNSDPANPVINALGGGGGTIIPLPTYAITNNTPDRTIDLTVTSLDEVSQVLGTLVNDIKAGLTGIANSTDFYKYQIVTSVVSNNLTVELKNYAGQTPSVTAPVKVQIGGVIRTITSALSVTMNAGMNWLNLGSSELATKEVDLFTYLVYDTTASVVKLGFARCGFFTTMADISITATNEKGYLSNLSAVVVTDKCVNIGRFSAILSAGAGYIWSLGSGTTINQYCNDVGRLSFVPQITGSGGGTATGISVVGFYKIIGSQCYIDATGSFTKNTLTGRPRISLPFKSYINSENITTALLGASNTRNNTQLLDPVLNNDSNNIEWLNGIGIAGDWSSLGSTLYFRINCNYNIK